MEPLPFLPCSAVPLVISALGRGSPRAVVGGGWEETNGLREGFWKLKFRWEWVFPWLKFNAIKINHGGFLPKVNVFFSFRENIFLRNQNKKFITCTNCFLFRCVLCVSSILL